MMRPIHLVVFMVLWLVKGQEPNAEWDKLFEVKSQNPSFGGIGSKIIACEKLGGGSAAGVFKFGGGALGPAASDNRGMYFFKLPKGNKYDFKYITAVGDSQTPTARSYHMMSKISDTPNSCLFLMGGGVNKGHTPLENFWLGRISIKKGSQTLDWFRIGIDQDAAQAVARVGARLHVVSFTPPVFDKQACTTPGHGRIIIVGGRGQHSQTNIHLADLNVSISCEPNKVVGTINGGIESFSANAPFSRYGMASAELSDSNGLVSKIAVSGGVSDEWSSDNEGLTSKVFDDVWLYDIDTKTWTAILEHADGRTAENIVATMGWPCAVAYKNDTLLTFGGFMIEQSPELSFTYVRGDATQISTRDKGGVCGGKTFCVNDLPSADNAEQPPPRRGRPSPRFTHDCVLMGEGGKLVVFGGQTYHNAPKMDLWLLDLSTAPFDPNLIPGSRIRAIISSPPPEKKKNLSPAEIAGIIIGTVAGVSLVYFGARWAMNKWKTH